MPNNLQVEISDPAAGEVQVAITYRGERVSLRASYLYNSFLELILALHRLLYTQGESVVTWRDGEGEVEMRYVRLGDEIALEIDSFDDQSRHKGRGTRLLFATGSYAEMCLPLWRAVHALDSRFSEEEMLARWQGRFPHPELMRLTEDIEIETRARP